MKKSKNILNRVSVDKPCAADWDKMVGNDAVRFCGHCAKSVHNLSAMTRRKAEKLVADSNGNLCIRYVRNTERKIATLDFPVQITRAGRRVSQFAASVFTAAIAVSSVAAQGGMRLEPNDSGETVAVQTAKKKTPIDNNSASIRGTIFDSQQAIIPGATVLLFDGEDRQLKEVTSNEEGFYEFYGLPAGIYSVRIDAPGFMQTTPTEITLNAAENRSNDVTLDVAGAMGGVMMVSSSIAEWIRHTDQRDDKDVEANEAIQDFFADVSDPDTDSVTEMLAGGFAVDAKNAGGSTALMFAGSAEMIRLLVKNGADVNAQNKYGETALMLRINDTELVRTLLDAGADVNAASRFGVTPLMYAIESSDAEIVTMLLTAGARIDAVDEEGRTALMFAVVDGDAEIVKLLIDAGANVGMRDSTGKTLLQYADTNEEIAAMLKAGGASE